MVFDDVIRTEKLRLKGKIEDMGCIYAHDYPENGYVIAQQIRYTNNGMNMQGAVLFYQNPPMHQLSDSALAEHMAALKIINKNKKYYNFLIAFGRHHPYHAGADIKENYARLKKNSEESKLPEYLNWSDQRLSKFVGMAQLIDEISASGVVAVSIASGYMIGASGEKTLMFPYVIADSRSKIQLKEPTLGIMPVVGVYLLRRKTNQENTSSIVLTADPFKAQDLYGMGIFNRVIQIDGPYVDPNKDISSAQKEDDRTHGIMFPAALDFVVDALQSPDSVKSQPQIHNIMGRSELEQQIAFRTNPYNYLGFRKSDGSTMKLREAQQKDGWRGTPLFRPSIDSIQYFLDQMNGLDTEELGKRRDELLKLEKRLDLGLYKRHASNILIGFESAIGGKVVIFNV